jgi:hypothetical membrane protein
VGKDIIRSNYNKFCLRISGAAVLSVLLVTIILSLVPVGKLLDQNYFSSIVINAAFYVSLVVAMAGVYRQNQLEKITYGRLWLVFAIMLGATYGFVANIIGHLFVFLAIDILNYHVFTPILVSCLTALICGVLAYSTAKGVFRLNRQKFLLLIVVTVTVGFCAATILTNNQDWWRTSICSLGMPRNVNSEYYNITLILFGLLSVLFAYYLRPQIRSLVAKGLLDRTSVFILASLYFMEMVAVALIGVFPYGLFEWANPVHMFLASFVFFDIMPILFFAFWFFRKFPRKFMITSYILSLIGATFYYLTGFANTSIPFAVTEIVTIVAVLLWIVLFLGTLSKMSSPKYIQTK